MNFCCEKLEPRVLLSILSDRIYSMLVTTCGPSGLTWLTERVKFWEADVTTVTVFTFPHQGQYLLQLWWKITLGCLWLWFDVKAFHKVLFFANEVAAGRSVEWSLHICPLQIVWAVNKKDNNGTRMISEVCGFCDLISCLLLINTQMQNTYAASMHILNKGKLKDESTEVRLTLAGCAMGTIDHPLGSLIPDFGMSRVTISLSKTTGLRKLDSASSFGYCFSSICKRKRVPNRRNCWWRLRASYLAMTYKHTHTFR